MNNELKNFNCNILKTVIPGAYNVRTPNVRGALNTVYFVDTKSGEYVCKFNHPDLALKNMATSKVLRTMGVPVPDVRALQAGDQWIEVYPKISGRTLYESIQTGISIAEVESIYHSVLYMFNKMAQINPDKIDIPATAQKYKYIQHVAKTNTADTTNSFVGSVVGNILERANRGAPTDMGLYHCGITPKNIIVSDNNKLMAFVDMDEVAVSNKNYAFAMMASKYQQMGHSIDDLMQKYQDTYQDKLDTTRIKHFSNLVNCGKHVLWRLSHIGRSK